ncbi:MAG: RpiB/LacA/LacB family sugar-phosphate isomerase [Patescibacteria group bacterium]
MIYLGADHAGFHLKEELKQYLGELGYEYQDLGAKEFEPEDDYSDYALEVAKKVAAKDGLGILICATGSGVCLAANKVKDIRASVVWNDFTALQAREHNNANVICLAGKVLDSETAKKIVRLWLEAEFTGEERHVRRLGKVKEAEK